MGREVSQRMARSRTKFWLSAFLAALAAGTVGACGVKSPLEPPAVAKAEGTAKSAESQDPGSNSAAPEKPHEPFVLDPLLR